VERLRRIGWVALAALTFVAASCGPPTATVSGETDVAIPSDPPGETGSASPTAGGGGAPNQDDLVVATAQNPLLGTILVDGEGFTLYLFTEDREGESTCAGECAAQWPPLLTGSDPIADDGADDSKLGTTDRGDGETQVTYAGHPLYLYAQDDAPGDVNGHEVGDVWYAVDRDGDPVGHEPGED
jgi:predicted lipoprotein with Yx(FWY)xxD motif